MTASDILNRRQRDKFDRLALQTFWVVGDEFVLWFQLEVGRKDDYRERKRSITGICQFARKIRNRREGMKDLAASRS